MSAGRRSQYNEAMRILRERHREEFDAILAGLRRRPQPTDVPLEFPETRTGHVDAFGDEIFMVLTKTGNDFLMCCRYVDGAEAFPSSYTGEDQRRWWEELA